MSCFKMCIRVRTVEMIFAHEVVQYNPISTLLLNLLLILSEFALKTKL